MSKAKQITNLLEEDNASANSPRRSSRIATRRLSSCDELPSSPSKTVRSRRPSLTLENNSTPGKITRSKRSSLSAEPDLARNTDSNLSTSPNKKSFITADVTTTVAAKRTTRRGSLSNSIQDEPNSEVALTPIPSRVTTRRLSGRRSMSKSPTSEKHTSPPSDNTNISKVTTPKRRGRRVSITERVVPLESIEETESNKIEIADEIHAKDLKVSGLPTVNTDKNESSIPKSDNLETILENSIVDSQDEQMECDMSQKVNDSMNKSKNKSLDLQENEEVEINLSLKIDDSINKSKNMSLAKDKSLNLEEDEQIENNFSLKVDESINKSKNKSLAKDKSPKLEKDEQMENNLSQKVNDAMNKSKNKSLTKNKSLNLEENEEEIQNNLFIKVNDSMNKSKNKSLAKDKSLNASQNISIKNNDSFKGKTEEILSENLKSALLNSSAKDKTVEPLETKEEKDLIDVLRSTSYLSGSPKPKEASSNFDKNASKDSFALEICEPEINLNLSQNKNAVINKSNESDKENKQNSSTAIATQDKQSEGLLSELMYIEDYPPDTSEENITNSMNNSVVEEPKDEGLNSTKKDEFSILSPIISSVGKRNKPNLMMNFTSSALLDNACASTPKKVLVPEIKILKSTASPSKHLKEVTDKDNLTDKSTRKSIRLNESNKSVKSSPTLNKSYGKDKSLNSSDCLNESNNSNRKSKSFDNSDNKNKTLDNLIDVNESIKSTEKPENVNRNDCKDKSLNKLVDINESHKKLSEDCKLSLICLDETNESLSKSKSIIDLSKSKSFSKGLPKTFEDLSKVIDIDDSVSNSDSKESPIKKSKCLSDLIDTDEEGDHDKSPPLRRSPRISQNLNINKSVTLNNGVNDLLSKKTEKVKLASLNKAVDKSVSDLELQSKINKFVDNYNLINDEDEGSSEHNSFIDDMAFEGEEDTPSEGSCDIPVEGESLGSSDSENNLSDSYEHDSFIVSDEEEVQLLSGNEFDLDLPKARSKRLTILKDSPTAESKSEESSKTQNLDLSKTRSKGLTILKDSPKGDSKPEESKTRDLDLSKTRSKGLTILKDAPKPEEKEASVLVEDDSDLENMSTKPYCGLDSPSVASSRESLSEADKIETIKKDHSNNSPKKSPVKAQDASFAGSLNISVVEDNLKDQCERSRVNSLLVQEQFQNYKVENVCDHISKVVNMIYGDKKKDDFDISLNVSLEFKQTPKKSEDVSINKLLTEPTNTICNDPEADSDLSADVDLDFDNKYYESRLIKKKEIKKPKNKYEAAAKEQLNSSLSEDSSSNEDQLKSSFKESDSLTDKTKKVKKVKKSNKKSNSFVEETKEATKYDKSLLHDTKMAKAEEVQSSSDSDTEEPTQVLLHLTDSDKKRKISLEEQSSSSDSDEEEPKQIRKIFKSKQFKDTTETKIELKKKVKSKQFKDNTETKIELKKKVKVQPKKAISNVKHTSGPVKRAVKEPVNVVPIKKIKKDENSKKTKSPLLPSKNLSDGDNLEVSYFPSTVLNTLVKLIKEKKPKMVPSKFSQQASWNCKRASPLRPSISIFPKKNKVVTIEELGNKRDFKTKTLNDKSRNKRMDSSQLLVMKQKMQHRPGPHK